MEYYSDKYIWKCNLQEFIEEYNKFIKTKRVTYFIE